MERKERSGQNSFRSDDEYEGENITGNFFGAITEKDTGAKSKTSETSSKVQEGGSCQLIIAPNVFAPHMLNLIIDELARQLSEHWQGPLKHGNVLTFQPRSQLTGLMFLEVFKPLLRVTVYQATNASGPSTEDPSVATSCQCKDFFLLIKNMLASRNYEFVTFRMCHGKAFVSRRTTTRSISYDRFRQLECIVNDISCLRERTSDFFSCTGRDEEFQTEVNGLRFQTNTKLVQFNSLKDELIASAIDLELQNGHQEQSSSGTVQCSKPNDTTRSAEVSTPEDRSRTENDSNSQTNSLPLMLQCISERLLLIDWVKLRQYIALLNIPQAVIENTPNGIQLLQELAKRNSSSSDSIRDAFYEIGRIDLVHLMDCIQDGDYSLLAVQQTGLQMTGSNNTADCNGLSSPPSQQMQNLTFQDKVYGAQAAYDSQYVRRSPSDTARGETGNPGDNGKLHRKFRNVPQSSQSSPAQPIQENVEENTANCVSATTVKAESSTTGERTTDGFDNRQAEQAMGSREGLKDRRPGDNTTWVENPSFSCEHYDRYCDVQFSCCPERFWPCHRCHNYNSSCSTRKLRSRDIKMIKCKRCGKVQQFPKESQHCIECNLKFAEYFCPMCQHLTGTQNHPFHCEKCGICRVHGDRSFHCDVCGVCLDVNLRGNHRCRAGSAHDECCICFEDAFTGCQILPCSHKVHKDCATLMLRNGITRCPICRESFAHRIERRPIP